MVQETQHNLRGVGSDTGPGCGIHVFTVVFIGVQKREKGVSHKKLSWQKSNKKEEMALQSSDFIVVLE